MADDMILYGLCAVCGAARTAVFRPAEVLSDESLVGQWALVCSADREHLAREANDG